MKFDMGDRMKICRETPYVLNIVQEYRVLHMTTYVRLIVVGDVIVAFLLQQWLRACTIIMTYTDIGYPIFFSYFGINGPVSF